MKDKQGALANKAGKQLEYFVEDVFIEMGYDVKSYREWLKHPCIPVDTGGILLTNVPYINIYGRKGRGEFVFKTFRKDIRIECRSQHSPGSVDEKLPYLGETCDKAFEEPIVLIVIDGTGFKRGAIEWLTKRCDMIKNKVVKVVDTYTLPIVIKSLGI